MRFQDDFTIQLLENWYKQCAGAINLDKSDYLTLFHNYYEQGELEKIFAPFPSSDELVARMERFQQVKAARESASTFLSSEKLLELAICDLRSKATVFEICGENDLYSIANQVTPKIESDRKTFERALFSSWPNGEKYSVLGDYFDDQWKCSDENAFALFEAFYGTANSYEIQWFLGAPLIDTDVNFENYLELWGNRAELALTEQHLLVFQDVS